MLRTQKHRQIRRLGELNPMDDAPDQDSAQVPEKIKRYFAYPSNPGINIFEELGPKPQPCYFTLLGSWTL